MPDVVVMHPDEVENYARGGKLLDLTEVLNGDIANASNFPQYVVDDFFVDGKNYGVPKDIGTMALVYNKDIFDKAGVAYPTDDWTWEDMAAASTKLTDVANDVYGIVADNNGQNFYWNLVWQNGGEFFDENGTCIFDSVEVVDAIKYAVSFIEKGESPTPADIANLSADEYFESGKAAMIFAGSWMLTEYLSVDGLNFDVAELPKQKEKAAICSGMAFSVSANTKNPEAAMKLIEFLGSEEAQTIEAASGVAIPAYNNTQQPWIDGFTSIHAAPFAAVADYGHVSPGLTTSNESSSIINEIMPEVFSLNMSVEDGCKQLAERINALN